MNSAHPHYALLAYAQEMHQYTLELWMEFTKKATRPDLPVLPSKPGLDSSNTTITSSSGSESGGLPRGGAVPVSDDPEPPQKRS